MLYLRVAPRLPWIDSKGRARSAVEEFSFLREEARTALESGSIGKLIVWEVGLLVAEDAPPESKAQIVSTQEHADLALFAVGVGAAENHHAALAPFWQAMLRQLAGPRTERLFLTDRFWHDASETWIDVGAAVQRGLFPPVKLHRVEGSRTNLYTAEMNAEELVSLVQRWWPSGLGMLAGISCADGHVEQQPNVSVEDLEKLHHYFQTSRSFDNLGLVVISPRSLMDQVMRLVPEQGWESIVGEGAAARASLFRRTGTEAGLVRQRDGRFD